MCARTSHHKPKLTWRRSATTSRSTILGALSRSFARHLSPSIAPKQRDRKTWLTEQTGPTGKINDAMHAARYFHLTDERARGEAERETMARLKFSALGKTFTHGAYRYSLHGASAPISRHVPSASPCTLTLPTAARISRSVGNPTLAVMRRTWRFFPSRIVSSSHAVGIFAR
jgi:hypothetical protein